MSLYKVHVDYMAFATFILEADSEDDAFAKACNIVKSNIDNSTILEVELEKSCIQEK